MHICRNVARFEHRYLAKNKNTSETECQRNSSDRISRNYVVMKDILCRYAYLQEIVIFGGKYYLRMNTSLCNAHEMCSFKSESYVYRLCFT